MCFPDGSDGKASARSVGDPGSIPGLGRSPGEGIGYPLQYSWASLVAQLVKNSPAMRETWVWSLGWEDPLEKEMAAHSSVLACRIPGTGEPGGLPSTGSHRVGHNWSDLAAAWSVWFFFKHHSLLLLLFWQLTYYDNNMHWHTTSIYTE